MNKKSVRVKHVRFCHFFHSFNNMRTTLILVLVACLLIFSVSVCYCATLVNCDNNSSTGADGNEVDVDSDRYESACNTLLSTCDTSFFLLNDYDILLSR